jgi:hypothetical protein
MTKPEKRPTGRPRKVSRMAADNQHVARALKLTARITELEADYNHALLADDKRRIAEVREQIVALHRQSAPSNAPDSKG